MALAKVKTEMKGTGGGRWGRRAEAKTSANKTRREADRVASSDPNDTKEYCKICDLYYEEYCPCCAAHALTLKGTGNETRSQKTQ